MKVIDLDNGVKELVEFESSNLKSIRWLDDILEVEFKRGETYQYNDVSYDKFMGFLGAESIGKYFIIEIKLTHDYRKV